MLIPLPPARWIEGLARGRLTVAPCPAFSGEPLEGIVAWWRESGVTVVASLLGPHEIVELGLAREPELCAAAGIEFLSFPIPDHSVPESMRNTLAFALRLAGLLGREKAVLIHCRAGIGRSVVVAACALALLGVPPDTAFERIGAARGFPDVPEMEEQREWVYAFAERVPGGGGR